MVRGIPMPSRVRAAELAASHRVSKSTTTIFAVAGGGVVAASPTDRDGYIDDARLGGVAVAALCSRATARSPDRWTGPLDRTVSPYR